MATSTLKCQCGGKLKKVTHGYLCIKCSGWYSDNTDFKALKMKWEKEKVASTI